MRGGKRARNGGKRDSKHVHDEAPNGGRRERPRTLIRDGKRCSREAATLAAFTKKEHCFQPATVRRVGWDMVSVSFCKGAQVRGEYERVIVDEKDREGTEGQGEDVRGGNLCGLDQR